MNYRTTQGLIHDIQSGKHVKEITCPCNPKILTGIIGAWRKPEYFNEWVVVHE